MSRAWPLFLVRPQPRIGYLALLTHHTSFRILFHCSRIPHSIWWETGRVTLAFFWFSLYLWDTERVVVYWHESRPGNFFHCSWFAFRYSWITQYSPWFLGCEDESCLPCVCVCNFFHYSCLTLRFSWITQSPPYFLECEYQSCVSCVCVWVCVWICMRVYIYTYIYLHTHTHTHIHTHIYIYIHIHVYIYRYRYIYVYIYPYIYLSVSIH